MKYNVHIKQNDVELRKITMGNIWHGYHFSSFLTVFRKTVEACLDPPLV